MTVNVLVDRHHGGLFHSLQLLGARLGWTIYTPTGHAWWDEWYWSFGRGAYGDDRLAQQFLTASGPDSEFPDWPIASCTLDEARGMRWDLVIATVQDNQAGFEMFARQVGAQYVYQVGNTRQEVAWKLDPLALVSSEVPIEGRGIVYHQEMDPITYSEPLGLRRVASFVNCMPSMGRCWDLLSEARARIPIEVHGIDGPEGIVKPYADLVRLMDVSDWGWHDKDQGDGFGHVIHSWAAVGRPLIGHASHYAGRMAEPFWRDGETCIDLDKHSIDDAVNTILTITPERHAEMCRAIRATFDRLVDYDAEAERIRDFLGVAVTA